MGHPQRAEVAQARSLPTPTWRGRLDEAGFAHPAATSARQLSVLSTGDQTVVDMPDEVVALASRFAVALNPSS